MQTESTNIQNLPYELLYQFALGLDVQSVNRFCSSNKHMMDICKDDQFWKDKYYLDYDSQAKLEVGETWKQRYKHTTLAIQKRHDSPVQISNSHSAIIDKEGKLYISKENVGITQFQIQPLNNIKVANMSLGTGSIMIVTRQGEVYGKGMLDFNLTGQLQSTESFLKLPIDQPVRKVSHSGDQYLFLLQDRRVLINDLAGFELGPRRFQTLRMLNIKAKDIAVISGRVDRDRPDESSVTDGLMTEFKYLQEVYSVYRYAIVGVNEKLYYIGVEFNPEENYSFLDQKGLDKIKPEIEPAGGVGILNLNLVKVGVSLIEEKIDLHPYHIPVNKSDKIQQVCLGLDHILILTTRGEIYTMGYNSFGQLGLRMKRYSIVPAPIKVDLPHKIKSISTYDFTSLALTEDGKVYIWGIISSFLTNDGVPDNFRQFIKYDDENEINHANRPILFSLHGRTFDQSGEILNQSSEIINYIAVGLNRQVNYVRGKDEILLVNTDGIVEIID